MTYQPITSDQFLPEDIKQATKEMKCCFDLLDRFGEAITQGEFERAAETTKELYRSSEELGKLRRKKEEKDQLNSLLNHLHQRGVNASIIIRQGSPYYGKSR